MAQAINLLDFPDELLLSVLSHISDAITLIALAKVCRRLQDLTEPFIYASHLITKGLQVQHLARALNARKERERFVHALDVRCRYTHTEGLSSLKTILPTLTNLKELTIESPWCNHSSASPDAWDVELESYAEIFRDASPTKPSQHPSLDRPLPHLHTCILHYSGAQDRYWPLDYAIALFVHPTLKELTISCAEADVVSLDIPFEKYRGSTPLRHLTMIECTMSANVMEALLSIPAALQGLEVTSRRPAPRAKAGSFSLGGLIHSLQRHQPELESLTYAIVLIEHNEVETFALTSLKLKHLALPYDYRGLNLSVEPFLKIMSSNQKPANLETLMIAAQRYGGSEAADIFSFRSLQLDKSNYPKLRTLIFSFAGLDRFHHDRTAETEERTFAEAFWKGLQEIFKDTGVRLILQATITSHYIPPYLYKEKAPYRKTLFDSGAELPEEPVVKEDVVEEVVPEEVDDIPEFDRIVSLDY